MTESADELHTGIPGKMILRVRGFATRDRAVFLPVSLASRLRPRLDIPKLDIREGRCYAVIGKSGAGKTVFNSFLVGWPAFQCGIGTRTDEIRWWSDKNAINVRSRQLTNPFRRMLAWKRIGRLGGLFYLPQCLPDGRGYAMKTSVYLRHVLAALRAQARVSSDEADVLGSAPSDVAANFDKGVDQLSGGERRRVELWARLRVLRDLPPGRPGLLVLDEPTTGLDVVQERKYLEMLRVGLVEAPNVSAVVTTHALHLLDDVQSGQKGIFDGVIVVWKKEFGSSRWKQHRIECDVSPVFSPILPSSVSSWENALDLFHDRGMPDWRGKLSEAEA